ncbi:hypothetical protein ACFQXA_23805 [Nocardiopsis composta]
MSCGALSPSAVPSSASPAFSAEASRISRRIRKTQPTTAMTVKTHHCTA